MNIDMIKIYGERNSGTRYMRQLIVKNIQGGAEMLDSDGIDDALLGWKHGFPMLRDQVLYIVMLRPAKQWLCSMYSHPYECHHIKDNSVNFRDFVTRRFYSSNRSGARKYAGEFRNILHARSMKYRAYFWLSRTSTNAMVFNIEAIKRDPEIVPAAFSKYDFLEWKQPYWVDIKKSVVDGKSHDSRTRPNRYELTDDNAELVDEILAQNYIEFPEQLVEQLTVAQKIDGMTSDQFAQFDHSVK